ncbi:MAG: hypothetical protein EBS84_21810 [Proteobacteria bacterium]|nr:hypothetical protein [Pseudomonadota bacterium]
MGQNLLGLQNNCLKQIKYDKKMKKRLKSLEKKEPRLLLGLLKSYLKETKNLLLMHQQRQLLMQQIKLLLTQKQHWKEKTRPKKKQLKQKRL